MGNENAVLHEVVIAFLVGVAGAIFYQIFQKQLERAARTPGGKILLLGLTALILLVCAAFLGDQVVKVVVPIPRPQLQSALSPRRIVDAVVLASVPAYLAAGVAIATYGTMADRKLQDVVWRTLIVSEVLIQLTRSFDGVPMHGTFQIGTYLIGAAALGFGIASFLAPGHEMESSKSKRADPKWPQILRPALIGISWVGIMLVCF